MNTKLPRFIISAAVLTLVVSFGVNLRAQPAASADSWTTTRSSTHTNSPASTGSSAATGQLSQAYAALSGANHDYQGHRVRAMRHIEAAAKELGVNLQGDGQGQEQQAVSDQQLRTAQSLLQQAAPALQGNARMHVDKAIDQLSIALSIK